MTLSGPVPPVVEDRGGVGVVLGSFSYVLCQCVGYLVTGSAGVKAEVVGCIVKRVVEQSDCSELVRGLDVSVAEESTVEIGKKLGW